MEELEKLKLEKGKASPVKAVAPYQTPPPTVKAPSPAKVCGGAPPPPSGPPAARADPQAAAPASEGARMARLRRMCEMKPSGKCHVPMEIHQRWKSGNKAQREKLADELEKAGWAKDIHKHTHTCVHTWIHAHRFETLKHII